MVKFILGISGKQGSGKSTLSKGFSELVSERWGLRVLNLAFADPIYDIHDSIQDYMGGFSIESLEKNGPLLQRVGDLGKAIYGDDIWARLFQTSVEDIHMKDGDDVVLVVDDIRFPREAETVRGTAYKLGISSFLVRLSADESIRKERCDSWRDDTSHASETALDQYGAGTFHTGPVKVWDLEIDTGSQVAERTLTQVTEATQDMLNLVDPEKVRMELALESLNDTLLWLKGRKKGANFKWIYTPEGTKKLDLISIDPIVPLDKNQEELIAAKAKEVLEKLEPSHISRG